MKVADVVLGTEYALQPSYGAIQRVKALGFDKMPQADRWTGNPTGRLMTQVRVLFVEKDEEGHVEARCLHSEWAAYEAAQAKRQAEVMEQKRLEGIATACAAELERRGVKARVIGWRGVEIELKNVESLAAFLGL